VPGSRDLRLETVDFSNSAEVDEFLQQVISHGLVRVRAENAELQARGLMDAEGNLLVIELPPDMREGSGMDCGW
jgi:hypothetical protein